jgi:alcohol dehydrogenase class IV
MEFEFATATRIVFGPGKLRELGAIGKSLGNRALIVTGRSPERARRVGEVLSGEMVSHAVFHLPGEPTVHDVRQGVEFARGERCDLVIGIGGGSSLDAAKAIAALLRNPGDLIEYLEVVGHGKPLTQPSAPCVTIPTTAGTGAEVTRNAVLASPEHRFKVSLRSPLMLARVALVDPELSRDLPPSLTASTGLDALTQLIEPYVSVRANPLTDGFCIEGMRRVQRSLQRAYDHGQDVQAREEMALASLLSGLALANAALGAVHGFAAPLGGMSSAPHGALCAALLPRVMEVNIRALKERQPDANALRRYTQVAAVLTGNPAATAPDGVLWVRNLCRSLGVRGLGAFGVRAGDFAELIEKAAKASSMKGNPIVLTPAELLEILEGSS